DYPILQRGGTSRIDDQSIWTDLGASKQFFKILPEPIPSNHPTQKRNSTQYLNIVGDVGRQSEFQTFFLDVNNGNGRFGRDPLDGPGRISIHTDVSYQQNFFPRKSL